MAQYHSLEQGECLSSIAKDYGFSTWKTIYEHPENEQFRKLRTNPNVIYPGDKIFIPDKAEPKSEPGETEKRHRFRTKTAAVYLKLIVKHEDDDPVANELYQLTLGSTVLTGKTDDRGFLKQRIEADARQGKLLFKALDLEWDLQLGHLDPVQKNSGIQSRLNNLGFPCGQVDGVVGPKTRRALRWYQRSRGLDASGKADEATRDQLLRDHDGE